MINIVNLKSYQKNEYEILIRVDRQSILGNPFTMKNESFRSQVCKEYEDYFNKKIQNNHINFKLELDKIYTKSLESNIALGCWCYPLQCHAETIKNYIDSIRIFCKWQNDTMKGILCKAESTGNRDFVCPFKTLEDRIKSEFPCSDYLPYYKK